MLEKLSVGNKQIMKNIIGAFVVKGGALIISVLLLPAYMVFFENETMLGIWYTILSILNWMTLFDLGLGNGLRNKLPEAIVKNDRVHMRELISTTYIIMTIIVLFVSAVGFWGLAFVDWNNLFNVEESVINASELLYCMRIVFIGIMLSIVFRIITSILYAFQYSAIVNALVLCTNIILLLAIIWIPSQGAAANLKIMSYINVVAVNLPYVVCTIILFCYTLKDCVPSIHFFRRDKIKEIMSIGLSLLWLTLVFMVVSSTNEMLISNITSPDNVVEYQVYYKIMNTGAMLMTLALTPIWSAVTKAQAQKNYKWIEKIYKFFLVASIGCLVLELMIVPLLQFIVNIWLGNGSIIIQLRYGVVFAISSSLFVLHNVNTSIGNGLSYFKLQLIWMTFAAIVFIPLAYLLVDLTDDWIGVTLAGIFALLPYEILAPVFTIKFLRKKEI